MDITNLTLEQLKALAYDQIMIIQQAQANLNLVNQQMEKLKEVEPKDVAS